MYDRLWAQGIVENYHKLCARAQQIDMCIQQLYKQRTGRDCTRWDIKVSLVDSVQGKTSASIWRLYKKVVKKTPLDKTLLEKICGIMIIKIDVDKLQRQFDWD